MWVKFVYYMQLIWAFVKKYWSLFLFVILTVISTILLLNKQKQVRNLLQMLQEQSQQHHKDMEELQKIHDEEQKKRDELQNQYNNIIAKINQQHAEAITNLNRQKEEEMKVLIQRFQDDPNRMAEELGNLLGLPIQLIENPTPKNIELFKKLNKI